MLQCGHWLSATLGDVISRHLTRFLRYIAHETIREQNESRKAITRDGVVLAFKAS
jgi:hypothetical protein